MCFYSTHACEKEEELLLSGRDSSRSSNSDLKRVTEGFCDLIRDLRRGPTVGFHRSLHRNEYLTGENAR